MSSSNWLLELAHAGRAGDVDLGDVAADHVQAHEQHAGLAQRRADLLRTASGRARSARRPTPLAPAARLPRLSSRRRDARQRVGHRLAVDQQHARVAADRRCRAGTSARSRSGVPSSVSVSNTTRAFLSPGSSTKIEWPPMLCSGLQTILPCVARERRHLAPCRASPASARSTAGTRRCRPSRSCRAGRAARFTTSAPASSARSRM